MRYATEWDQVVSRGDLDPGECIAFRLQGRRVPAGTNVYVWDAIEHLQVLVHARRTVDVAGLSDPNTSHASLLSELTTAG